MSVYIKTTDQATAEKYRAHFTKLYSRDVSKLPETPDMHVNIGKGRHVSPPVLATYAVSIHGHPSKKEYYISWIKEADSNGWNNSTDPTSGTTLDKSKAVPFPEDWETETEIGAGERAIG